MFSVLELLNQKRWPEALVAARAAFDPADQESCRILGLACAMSGHLDEAAELLTQALQSGQGPVQSWQILAAVQLQRGDTQAELSARRRAVELSPDDADLWLQLASCQLDYGDGGGALGSVTRALDLKDSTTGRRLFVSVLADHRQAIPELRDRVRRALAESWGRPAALFNAALVIIRATDLPPEQDDLLAELLTSCPVQNAALETDLTTLRRKFLLERRDADRFPSKFLDALARQCWINEYCWATTDEEKIVLQALPSHSPMRALYGATEEFAPVSDIPRLTAIREGISADVRAMYEVNPYPRWTTISPQDPRPFELAMRSTFPRIEIEPIPGADILIAGCGTGQHALEFARRYSDASVLAVDLSLSSLSYAIGKARDLGVSNLTFGQADILELKGLGRTFSAISCAGTLQAMADPLEGFRVLFDLLRPGGVLHLGLYSRTARAELAPAMALAKTYPPTTQGIRDLRQVIMRLPDSDPARAALGWNDFYATSMVRDMLMHVQEHQSTIADIGDMMALGGLKFLGFDVEPEIQRAYRASNPDDLSGTDLMAWAAFEDRNTRAFRGMYQFWAQRPSAGGNWLRV